MQHKTNRLRRFLSPYYWLKSYVRLRHETVLEHNNIYDEFIIFIYTYLI